MLTRDFFNDVSEKNQVKKALYKLIHKKESISKVELLHRFHIPNTTMTRLVADLVKKKLIRECGVAESNGGRPSVLYEVVPDAGYLVGVEIARTHVGIMLFDLNFKPVGADQFMITNKHTPEVTIKLIIEGIKHLLTQYRVNPLLGIGIGAVGPIDRKNGVIINPSAFPSKGWLNIPIVSMLKGHFDVPVVLNNGANTAALAEYHANQSLQGGSLLYCISGYGIRCGFIKEGQLFSNRQGAANTFGHITIQADGRPCTCGNKGCLSSYVTFGALFDRMKEKGISASMDQLLNSKDPAVKEIILESARYYGIGIANMINVLHPDTVLLHGKLIYHDREYYEEVVRVAMNHTYMKEISIKKGSFGEKATCLGAAILVFDQFFNE